MRVTRYTIAMIAFVAAIFVGAAAVMNSAAAAEAQQSPFAAAQRAIEFIDAVELRGESRTEAVEAVWEYDTEIRRISQAERLAVGDIAAELAPLWEQKRLEREQHLFNPNPPVNKDLDNEMRRLFAAKHNATRLLASDRIAAEVRLIEDLERIVVAAENVLVYPRPRMFILSRHEPAPTGNVLDLRTVELHSLVSDSFESGILRDAVERLAATDPREDRQFRAEIRMALHEHAVEEERLLTEWHLRVAPSVREDAEALTAEFANNQRDDLLRRNGRRWTQRFAARQRHVENIAGVLEGFSLRDHAERWRDGYKLAVAPEIFKPRWPLEMVNWLAAQPEATDAEFESARLLLASYMARVEAAQERAYAAAQRASGVTGLLSMKFWEAREYEQCQQAILALHLLGRDTLVQFRRNLSPVLQERVRELWLTKRRDLAGPWPLMNHLDESAVETLLNWPDMPPLWGR